MNKSAIPVLPNFFDRYINYVENGVTLREALRQQASLEILLPLANLNALGNRVYAPGKWTAKDIVQHLMDTERILAYRALRIARNDKTPLPGFDEDNFAEAAQANHRNLNDLYNEWAAVRQATILLFDSFTDEMLLQSGTASGQAISVLALGFVIVGHTQHHAAIWKERYEPLME